MSRHGNASRLRRMLELPVTTCSRYQDPTIVSKELQDIANFHGVHMISAPTKNQKPYKVELTRRREFNQTSLHESSCETRSRRSRPTVWLGVAAEPLAEARRSM